MLRAFVAVLLVLNGLFFAWSHGWLDGVLSVRSQGEREPERLARQINPQAVKLLSKGALRGALPASAPASAADAAHASDEAASAPVMSCLEAGPFTTPAEQRAAADEIRRAALPEGTVASAPASRPGTYIVYMGKYAAPDQLQKKIDELRHLKVDFEELRSSPGLEPGLALGRFTDKAMADARLASLAERGVHTAKVVTLTPAATGVVWRVAQADANVAAKLTALKSKTLGAGFVPCAPPAGSSAAR